MINHTAIIPWFSGLGAWLLLNWLKIPHLSHASYHVKSGSSVSHYITIYNITQYNTEGSQNLSPRTLPFRMGTWRSPSLKTCPHSMRSPSLYVKLYCHTEAVTISLSSLAPSIWIKEGVQPWKHSLPYTEEEMCQNWWLHIKRYKPALKGMQNILDSRAQLLCWGVGDLSLPYTR